MFKLLLLSLIAIPTLSNAALIREIGAVEYNLHDDFDTADGECVIRGGEYASSFYSSPVPSRAIIKLNADGTVKEIMEKMDINTWVIDGISCQ